MPNDTSSPQLFKSYHQHQTLLFPPSLEDLLPADHLARCISSVVDKLSFDELERSYPGGGAPSYHPKMMLKVFLYAYSQGVFSGRRIAKAAREQVPYMWLSGMQTPDFRSINRFRSTRLQGRFAPLFASLLALLVEERYVTLDAYYVDGTKIEANANKYSYVWRKSVLRHDAGLRTQIEQMLSYVDQTCLEEDARYGDRDLEEVDPPRPIDRNRILDAVERIEQALDESDDPPGPSPDGETEQDSSPKAAPLTGPSVDRQARRQLRTIKRKLFTDALPRLERYTDQLEQLGTRNSMSKTDADATFMRMKDDVLGTGQLKAAYNVQMGTVQQYILGYSVHQNANDSRLLRPHVEGVREQLGQVPSLVADSGYGSEENYAWMEQENIDGYVKYNTFHTEQKRSVREDRFRTENLRYDTQSDCYYCPNDVALCFTKQKRVRTASGYITTVRMYTAEDCTGCGLRETCHKSEGNRCIAIRPRLQRYREEMRERLFSEQGLFHRSQRGVEIEAVFGQLKQNLGFRRFHLRGLPKVEIELGILAMAHNLKKLWSSIQRKRKAAQAHACAKYRFRDVFCCTDLFVPRYAA